MNKTILEYLEGYFGGELNESTSDEDIMEAFDDLLETANAVEEYLNEVGPLDTIDLANIRTRRASAARNARDPALAKPGKGDAARATEHAARRQASMSAADRLMDRRNKEERAERNTARDAERKAKNPEGFKRLQAMRKKAGF